MDLSKVLEKSETGSVMVVKDPNTNEPILNDDGSEVTITLAGMDSARWRKAQDMVGDKRLKSANPKTGSSYKSMADVRDDQSTLLAHATIAWSGIELDGAVLECTVENAKKLYSRPNLVWLSEQVDKFIFDRANFSTAS